MKISEYIRKLQEVIAQQGDIEIVRGDGKPFEYIVIEEQSASKYWIRLDVKDLK